jgi:hypothetical protein
MPRRTSPCNHSRVRFTAVAAVACGHIALFVLLARTAERDGYVDVDDRMTLVFFDLPDAPAESEPVSRAARAASPAALGRRTTTPAVIPPSSSAISQPGIDWHDAARRSAAREAAAPEARDFGFPKREPAPREKKDFGWDKTHTERVSEIPGGGILIRLSDNCALILAPLPLGGCALGKRKARGDLFDEMQAPAELGDWKP